MADQGSHQPELETAPQEMPLDVQQAARAVETLIERGADAEQLAPAITEQEAPDAADSLENLDTEAAGEVVSEMDAESAADALAHMVPTLAVSVLLGLPRAESAKLLEQMPPDDAADLIQEMPREVADDLIAKMHPRRAAWVRKLALSDPESAGGIMTPEIGVVRSGLTVGQAIAQIKRTASADESQYDLYVVDDVKRLVGRIGLRTLLIVDDNEPIADHLEPETHLITPDMDREEVAREFERYDLLTAPVIDEHGRVLGMITVDDVIDIIAAEATEDSLKQVGAGADEGVYSSLGQKLKGRMPWLVVNLVTSQLASAIILGFAGLIELIPVVAVLFPVIANSGGNAGHQSFAITLRGIVTGEVRPGHIRKLVMREMGFGVLSGLIVGVVFAFGVTMLDVMGIIDQAGWQLGVVAGLAMLVALWTGCLTGTLMPIVISKLGADPATASSIFLTMLTDAIAFASFLGMCLVAKDWLLAGAM